MGINEISLGFPDPDTVSIHADGIHVANMTSVDPDGITIELFDLLRAAPAMRAAIKGLLDRWQPTVKEGEAGWDEIQAAVKAFERADWFASHERRLYGTGE
jgi:hypothetical protein